MGRTLIIYTCNTLCHSIVQGGYFLYYVHRYGEFQNIKKVYHYRCFLPYVPPVLTLWWGFTVCDTRFLVTHKSSKLKNGVRQLLRP